MIVKNLILIIFIIIALLFSHIPFAAASPLQNIAAAAALLADVDSGMVLFEYNKDITHPTDALVKVMTLLLVITAVENGDADPDDLIIMTESAQYDIGYMSTTQDIMPGEEMTLLDLMYSAYVGGANEACNLLAEHVAGSIGRFIVDMNARAKELGCLNTNFTNTHGQYHDRQYTTAMDQFIIFREAISYPLFLEISSTHVYETEITNMSGSRRLISSNLMFSANSKYYYRPCTSGLASATFEGGYSFVSLAEANGLTLICVVLGSDDFIYEDDSVDLRNFTETQRLYEWGLSQFSWRTVLSSTDPVGKAPVMHGAGADFVNLIPESSITLLLDNDIPNEDFNPIVTIYTVESGETLYAPVYAGDVLGEIMLTRDGVDYGPILLVANTDIELHRMQYIRMQVSEMLSSPAARTIIWILVIVILGYTALVVRYNVIRRKRLRKISEAKERLREERLKEEHQELIRTQNSADRDHGSGRREQLPRTTEQRSRNKNNDSWLKNQRPGIRNQGAKKTDPNSGNSEQGMR